MTSCDRPNRRTNADELTELVELQGQRTAATLATIAHWDDPTVVLPWTNLALDLIRVHPPNPVRAARALALLHVALFDTLVATGDARAAYPRPGPATDKAVVPLGRADRRSHPSPRTRPPWPPPRPTVLAYLFPNEPAETFAALADEAATSQLLAARAFRSDVEAGPGDRRAVGERAVARGKADGSDTTWDGSGRLTDDGSWQPTPPGYFQQPAEPLAGTWRTWILASGDQYRPRRPRRYQSPAWQAELAGVQEAVARRTPEQEAAVRFWAGGPGTVTPAGLWIEIARDLIVRDGLDAAHAARVLALTSVAMADGFICCWDAKYTYWTERPITADPSLDVLIPTPPFPSYTSGHSTISAAAATVLGSSLSRRRSSAARTGGRSQELAALGRHPFPHRQRDGRPRRRHDRAPGRGPRARGWRGVRHAVLASPPGRDPRSRDHSGTRTGFKTLL